MRLLDSNAKVFFLRDFGSGTPAAVSSNLLSSIGVGVGTTTPIGKLSIHGGDSSGAIPQLTIGGGVAANAISDLYVLDSKNLNSGVGYGAKVIGLNIQNQVDSANQVVQRTTWGGVTGASAIYLGTDDVNQGSFGILTSPQESTAGTVLSERFTVRGNGNVGIGTATLTEKLHVAGNIISQATSTSGGYYFNSTSHGLRRIEGTNNVELFTTLGNLYFSSNGAGSNHVTILNSGYVGIGTVTPQALLQIQRVGTSVVNPELLITGSLNAVNAGHSIDFRHTGNVSYARVAGVTNSVGGAGEISLWTSTSLATAASECVRITGAGNVGIGTIAPQGVLDVAGINSYFGTAAGGARINATGSGAAGGAGIWLRYTNNDMYLDGAQGIRFRTNLGASPVDAMHIDNAGNVGIGIASPTSKLHVSGAAIFNNNVDVGGTIQAVGMTGLRLINGTSNLIEFNGNGVGAPTFTSRSAGTKMVLYPFVSADAADFAIGIETSCLWFSTAIATNTFKWYGGTTLGMSLTNGVLDVISGIKVSGSPVVSVPVGGVIPWLKTLTGTPGMPDEYREANGTNYTPPDSSYPYWNGGSGISLPDLNGSSGSKRFLRGSTTSGSPGSGTPSHSHTITVATCSISLSGSGTTIVTGITSPSGTTDATPPYYETVMIIRVK